MRPVSPHSSSGGDTVRAAHGDAPPVPDEPHPPTPTRWAWQRSYARALVWTDTAVVLAAVTVAHLVRFGDEVDPAALDRILLSVALVAVWLTALRYVRSRSARIIGAGYDEYQRVVGATLRVFGAVAVVALLFAIPLARGYLAIAFPAGLVVLLVARWAWRISVARRRERGDFVTDVLVVGSVGAVRALARTLHRAPRSAHRIVGVCVPGGECEHRELDVDGVVVPVYGDEASVLCALVRSRADTVAVTATETLGNEGIRELVWDLEPFDVELVVSTGVVDVSSQRVELRPVAGLPLLHVTKPSYHGAQRTAKRVFDIAFSIAALVAVSPLAALVAVAIKLDSPGPVLYRSRRIGLDGEPFWMLKFRSMVVDADRRRADLVTCDEGAGPLFKVRSDPRVTRVGRIIRRYSIDELPQFYNVLRRDMSVVGPRPPLPAEVVTYDGAIERRLLVRPGVTGLWQVSGRSDLTWEESVRLDLSYVENWSMVSDVLIVLRTVKAVTVGGGAY